MRRRAFTIIELLVAVTIVGLLLAAGVVQFGSARKASRDSARIGDVLVIARAIDQAHTLSRGTYPLNLTGGSKATMCAHDIVNATNGNQIDLSLFPSRAVPRDPLPSLKNGVCSDPTNAFLSGYSYHTEYGRPTNGNLTNANLAAYQQVTYSLEVGLENQSNGDQSALRLPSQLGIQSRFPDTAGTPQRYRYVLNGTSCATACYGP